MSVKDHNRSDYKNVIKKPILGPKDSEVTRKVSVHLVTSKLKLCRNGWNI